MALGSLVKTLQNIMRNDAGIIGAALLGKNKRI